MKKITLATVKSFIKKNQGKLHINVKSSFDGMVDGVMPLHAGFTPVMPCDLGQSAKECTLGIKGAWFVGCSRDYFTVYADGTYTGIEVYNSCGKFILATRYED